MRFWLAFLFILSMPLFAQRAAADNRLAFVVGVDNYDNLGGQAQLQKARADARAVAQSLGNLGFKVSLLTDVSRSDFNRHWQDFVNQLQPGDTAAFYFAGHGVELGGRNYLLPRDIPSIRPGRDELLRREALSLQEFLADLKEKGTRLNIVVIDACRDNPFEKAAGRSLGRSRGLALTEPPEGTFIMFSAATGESALDRLSDQDADPNSVFTRQLLPLLAKPGLTLTDVAEDVRLGVHRLASSVQHRQTPAYYNQVLGRFCLAGGACQAGRPATSVPGAETLEKTAEEAEKLWQQIRDTRSIEALDAYIAQFSRSSFAVLARDRIAALRSEAEKARAALAPQSPDSQKKAAATNACPRLPPRLTDPVAVRKGTRLCAETGSDFALIKNVTERAVIFTVNGGFEISCSTTELCQFAWPNAPLFNVRLSDEATAELIAPRR
jgi:hypothetical protein